MGSGEGASLTVPPESWKSDRRVRHLLERNMDKDEHIRFVIEGMEGQCIVALDERLLVIKPGSAADPHYSGLVTSINYSDIDSIETDQAASNWLIKINASTYQVTEGTTGKGPPEVNFFLSNEPTSIPVAKWTLKLYKPQLLELSELVNEARGLHQSPGPNTSE
jgi:hypothetical protein